MGTSHIDTHWRVKTGTSCQDGVNGGNGHVGLSSFHEIAITQAASHGLASVSQFYRFAYKPAAGFSGKDHFAIKIKFDTNGVDSQTNVDFDVDVVEAL